MTVLHHHFTHSHRVKINQSKCGISCNEQKCAQEKGIESERETELAETHINHKNVSYGIYVNCMENFAVIYIGVNGFGNMSRRFGSAKPTQRKGERKKYPKCFSSQTNFNTTSLALILVFIFSLALVLALCSRFFSQSGDGTLSW